MKTRMILVMLLIGSLTLGQDETYKKELIELASIYSYFHIGNEPSKEIFDKLNSVSSNNLLISKNFISELIKSNNSITTKKYLLKPDYQTLKNVFIIRSISWNMYGDDQKDNLLLIDSLIKENTNQYELLSCYYGMLFKSIGNKNYPFDMSSVNFTLSDYNLENEIEKGIFFLESMEAFGNQIWGYINIPKPPNYNEALLIIDNFPKYNGVPYYKYIKLDFKDFNLTTEIRKPKESYKKYYLNKYLNTLLYHAMCTSRIRSSDEDKYDVLLNSIIKNESYWKYSEKPEIFEQIFKKSSEVNTSEETAKK